MADDETAKQSDQASEKVKSPEKESEQVRKDALSFAGELVNRIKRETSEQKDPDRAPKFTSLKFGRPEITGDDGTTLVKAMVPTDAAVQQEDKADQPDVPADAHKRTDEPKADTPAKDSVWLNELPVQLPNDWKGGQQPNLNLDAIENSSGDSVLYSYADTRQSNYHAPVDASVKVDREGKVNSINYKDGTSRAFDYDDNGNLIRVDKSDGTYLERRQGNHWVEKGIDGRPTGQTFDGNIIPYKDGSISYSTSSKDGTSVFEAKGEHGGVTRVETRADGTMTVKDLPNGHTYVATTPATTGGSAGWNRTWQVYDNSGKLISTERGTIGIDSEGTVRYELEDRRIRTEAELKRFEKYEVYKGEDIKRDVPSGNHKVSQEDKDIESIAKKHLGPDAKPEDIQKYKKEVEVVNKVTDPLKQGQVLKLPGHTKNGGFVLEESDGSKVTRWQDGIERGESKDGKAGYVRKPDEKSGGYTEHRWGPNASDNYELIKTGDRRYLVKDATSDRSVDKTDADPPDVRAERARVDDKAQGMMLRGAITAEQYNDFRKNMQKFEELAAREGLDPVTVAKMYRVIDQQSLFDVSEALLKNAGDETAARIRAATGPRLYGLEPGPLTNDRAVENALSDMSEEDKRLYLRGRELAERFGEEQSHAIYKRRMQGTGDFVPGASELNLSQEDHKALAYFRHLRQALENAGDTKKVAFWNTLIKSKR